MSATDHTLTAPERENIEELLRLHVLADDEQIVYDLFETLLTQRGVTYEARLATAEAEKEALRAEHRDLVSRLGFGDNITEPMADNDTIVEWVEALGRDANEWGESQAWRIDCALAGHPDDEDCHEHDPSLTAEAEKEALRADRDEIADRLSVVLCDLTGGKLSKTGYSAQTMIQAVEEEFEERAEAAEAALAGLVAAVEALAEASLQDGRGGAWVHDVWFRILLDADHAAALRAREALAWDDAVTEGFDGGWLHDAARDDLLARNPYRADSIEQARP